MANKYFEKEILKTGDGVSFPNPGDTVVVHYVGHLKADGKKFDSSRDRNKEFEAVIGAGKVIEGWDEAIPQMSVGEIAKLTIKPEGAYGNLGFPPVIPKDATLEFEVELRGIKRKARIMCQ